VQLHLIASTGRTATTFLARAIDSLDGAIGCHEGYRAADKDSTPILPLVNLDNRQAFYSQEAARRIVAEKRSPTVIAEIARSLEGSRLIDVAYYNVTIGSAVLEAHPGAKLVAIIRQLEPFVRSATAMSGEDLLPVGWPDPAKDLTARERFIEMGRIRPAKGSKDDQDWAAWSAIMRNIWLWRETNAILLRMREIFGDRVLVLPFEELHGSPENFLASIARHFGIPETGIAAALASAKEYRNQKTTGYQIGPVAEWTNEEQAFYEAAANVIGNKL